LIEDLTAALDSAGGAADRSRSDRYGLSTECHSQVATLQELRRQSTEVALTLAKFENGTYGICESCSERISPARLEIHPGALLCVPCAADR
jgi:DnaK suppressor protein